MITKFSELINESFAFKEDKGAGKPTYVLILDEMSYDRISHLFNKFGKPLNQNELTFSSEGSLWVLNIQKFKSKQKDAYKVYGVSGDYTFGNAPTQYQQKFSGNKKAAKEIFSQFIDKYLK